ncbi:HalOD1 output domain-containing protein [Halogranum rubrum]|uniref:Halobacterial output domain-containing protein n=1 Tax=Halogranum salarium B-1 TaxID=1210908 RepID=J3JEH2_9EURY|nr:HalOD1 output domain-containing protein [Halogranum salarium]EJN58359.1 hypothetical protein HSB1_37760 [Halogranum salarium B-1]
MMGNQVSVQPEQRLVHLTRHARESGESLSTAVASAVAAADDNDPTETSWTLTEYVDPDALDSLFDRYSDVTDGVWRFEFAIHCYCVVVEGSGIISVYRRL